MIGTEVKKSGDEKEIRQYCKNIPVYDLSNATFSDCDRWYLIECISGDGTIAKHKSKAAVSTGLKSVDICDMDILSKIDMNHPYHNMFVVLVGIE